MVICFFCESTSFDDFMIHVQIRFCGLLVIYEVHEIACISDFRKCAVNMGATKIELKLVKKVSVPWKSIEAQTD